VSQRPIIAGFAFGHGVKKNVKSGRNPVTFFAKVGQNMIVERFVDCKSKKPEQDCRNALVGAYSDYINGVMA